MASHIEAASPVKLIRRRVACENSKLTVFFDHIVEGKKEVMNFMVVTPRDKSDQPLVVTGVSILPVDRRNRVGLQPVWRHAVERWTWEVPRGFIDQGESMEQAAIRELQEEAGLLCRDEDLVALGGVLPEGGVIRGRNALFAATHAIAAGTVLDDEIGIGPLEWFSLETALAMADRSEIEDATTLAALYRWARRGA
jgi:ADP-ribose pyrophosphatase